MLRFQIPRLLFLTIKDISTNCIESSNELQKSNRREEMMGKYTLGSKTETWQISNPDDAV